MIQTTSLVQTVEQSQEKALPRTVGARVRTATLERTVAQRTHVTRTPSPVQTAERSRGPQGVVRVNAKLGMVALRAKLPVGAQWVQTDNLANTKGHLREPPAAVVVTVPPLATRVRIAKLQTHAMARTLLVLTVEQCEEPQETAGAPVRTATLETPAA